MRKNQFEVSDAPFYASMIYNLEKGDSIDEDVFNFAEAGDPLLTECQYTKGGIAFDITNKMPMRRYLSSTMDKHTVIRVFLSIVGVFSLFENKRLDPGYIILDSDFVLVDHDDESLSFMCCPVIDRDSKNKPLRAYLKELLVNIQYDESENLAYVGRIITYINKQKQLKPKEMQYFLAALQEDDLPTAKIDMQEVKIPDSLPVADAIINNDLLNQATKVPRPAKKSTPQPEMIPIPDIEPEPIHPVQEEEPDELIKDIEKLIMNYDIDKEPQKDQEILPEELEKLLPDNDDEPFETIDPSKFGIDMEELSSPREEEPEPEIDLSVLEESTAKPEIEPEKEDIVKDIEKLIQSYNSDQKPKEAAPLPEIDFQMPKSKPIPYMIRKKNGEKVELTGDEFKIGKIPGMADYLLSDNPAVSRMHAIIRNFDGAYYVCDNYSTNATYLNDERLEAGKNYLLLSGAKIKFANEEFTYYAQD